MKTIQTTEQFQDIISGDQEVIIKFHADWCPDCTRMDMFIDPIVKKYNRYEWYAIDRDELPNIANDYEVMGIPSLLIFQNGKKKAHLHSAHAKSPDQVIAFLDQF